MPRFVEQERANQTRQIDDAERRKADHDEAAEGNEESHPGRPWFRWISERKCRLSRGPLPFDATDDPDGKRCHPRDRQDAGDESEDQGEKSLAIDTEQWRQRGG